MESRCRHSPPASRPDMLSTPKNGYAGAIFCQRSSRPCDNLTADAPDTPSGPFEEVSLFDLTPYEVEAPEKPRKRRRSQRRGTKRAA